MTLLLIVLAVFCFVSGIRSIMARKLLPGAILIVVGLLIVPVGLSIFH